MPRSWKSHCGNHYTNRVNINSGLPYLSETRPKRSDTSEADRSSVGTLHPCCSNDQRSGSTHIVSSIRGEHRPNTTDSHCSQPPPGSRQLPIVKTDWCRWLDIQAWNTRHKQRKENNIQYWVCAWSRTTFRTARRLYLQSSILIP